MDKNTRIAFLGLGTMGAPMAGRVLAAGYPLTVWNRTPERADDLRARGATVAGSPADAVRDADVVVTMLADPAAVREVVAAVVPALRPGAHLVDASTVGPDVVREVAALLPAGVTLVDAPVMGSADRAATGELSLLVGGDADAVTPLLSVFGAITRTGELGTGAALKLVLINAVVVGVTAVAEAMTLADALGLPEDLTKGALAVSPLAGLAGRAFATGAHFPIRLAAKDVGLAAAAASLPLSSTVHKRLTEPGVPGDEDLGRIVDHLRKA
ncbi:NAD(P)-dependent oxidoreductase [Umezawaea endophytica]|uniref:NAD(P)-dependent oxidoreductase n=1 Tax=Umezawaea endophytica TaxID=1654476 RepID=A0A9X3AD58_9PSEU|nr:NAD(P)-dependent oxidoreductase [Umezawaea endophytica]MCS7475261.1 NAD(P)-dependent oxidoreductase [Umezawaea endophytica]